MPNDAPSSQSDRKQVQVASNAQRAGADAQGHSATASNEGPLRDSSNADSFKPTIIQDNDSREEKRPPLPPRPTNLSLLHSSKNPETPRQKQVFTSRPQLLSTATTAVSRTDINTHSYQDGSRETFAASAEATPQQKSSPAFGSIRRIKGFGGSEAGDTASIKSYSPTLSRAGDNESLLGNVFGSSQDVPAWKLFTDQEPSEMHSQGESEISEDFHREFDSIDAVAADGDNEGTLCRGVM